MPIININDYQNQRVIALNARFFSYVTDAGMSHLLG